MPAKKIDPDEQKRKEKRITVKRKLAFVAAVGILVLIANLYMMIRPSEETAQKEQETVLGESHILPEEDQVRLQRVQRQANELANRITSESEKAVEEGREKVEQTVSDVVYAKTIKPIVDRINSLPDDQQQYIRQELCRAPEPTPTPDKSE
jgi:hypothetical protein